MFAQLADYLGQAIGTTVLQLIVLLGPTLVLAYLMNSIAQRVGRHAYRTMGRKIFLSVFGWLGTAVHELGHALFCVVFRHRIIKIELFKPDPETGTLGYVNHAFNRASLYQKIGNFFIGIGPILLGTFVIYCASLLLLGPTVFGDVTEPNLTYRELLSFESFLGVIAATWSVAVSALERVFSWEMLSSWKLYLFIYLTFSIGSSISLSRADVEGALHGFSVFVFSLFVFNLLTLWIGDLSTQALNWFSGMMGSVYAIMIIALVLNGIIGILVLLISHSASKMRRAA